MPRFTLPASLILTLASAVTAQTLTLDKSGGGIPGNLQVRVEGPAGALYAVVFALSEQSTPVPAPFNITMDIPLDFLDDSLNVPGFSGNIGGSGVVTATVPLSNDLGFLTSMTVSMQAAGYDNVIWFTSNLVRVTPKFGGTFAPALNQPALPIAGGGVAPAADKQLLFVGGSGPAAQRYKSRTEEWEAAGTTFGVGNLSQTTGLPDGRVLFTGGLDLVTGQPTNAAAVYDPVTQTTTTLAMGIARAGHGASVMGNGRVLISGGFEVGDFSNPLALFSGLRNSSEIFDPATNTFTPGPNMLEARAMHTSTTLTNGQVLVAGGLSLIPIVNIPTVSATAYKFNPTTNSFGLPSAFQGGRFFHSAVALSNGKVLLCGGVNLDLTTFLTTLNFADIVVSTRTDCQVYTASPFGFGTFATVNGMQEGRAGAALAQIPGGGALIAGGFQLALDIPNSQFVFNPTASADVYALNNTITGTGPMAAPRLFPTAVNLPDNTILVVGGGPANVEIYQPN
jgi:hypothetical protein